MVVFYQWVQTSSSGSGILWCQWCLSRTWTAQPEWRHRMLWPTAWPRKQSERSRPRELNWENILAWDHDGLSSEDSYITHVLIWRCFLVCTDGYKWVDSALGAGGGPGRANPGLLINSTRWQHLWTPHHASICARARRPCWTNSATGHALYGPRWQFTS